MSELSLNGTFASHADDRNEANARRRYAFRTPLVDRHPHSDHPYDCFVQRPFLKPCEARIVRNLRRSVGRGFLSPIDDDGFRNAPKL